MSIAQEFAEDIRRRQKRVESLNSRSYVFFYKWRAQLVLFAQLACIVLGAVLLSFLFEKLGWLAR
jgi:hypothetical protein